MIRRVITIPEYVWNSSKYGSILSVHALCVNGSLEYLNASAVDEPGNTAILLLVEDNSVSRLLNGKWVLWIDK